jgi:hypothetical protein
LEKRQMLAGSVNGWTIATNDGFYLHDAAGSLSATKLVVGDYA